MDRRHFLISSLGAVGALTMLAPSAVAQRARLQPIAGAITPQNAARFSSLIRSNVNNVLDLELSVAVIGRRRPLSVVDDTINLVITAPGAIITFDVKDIIRDGQRFAYQIKGLFQPAPSRMDSEPGRDAIFMQRIEGASGARPQPGIRL
jgi:hypothetical protein